MASKGRSAKRREGRQKAIEQLWSLKEGVASYADIFQAAIDVERLSRKSLLGIHEIPAGSALGAHTNKQLFEHFGHCGNPVDWQVGDDEGYDASSTFEAGHAGGTTSWLSDAYANIHTVVIMRLVDVPGLDVERGMTANIATFYHEIGHVDDFEKRVNFVSGQKLDLCAAELYAHEFTTRKLFNAPFKAPLGFYTGNVIPQLAAQPVRPISEAANLFMKSPAYDEYKAFAEDHHDYWTTTIPTN